MSYLCPACKTRQESGDINKNYHCGFFKSRKFDPENWGCATLEKLGENVVHIYGNDQGVSLVSHQDHVGMIALSRYKRRGRIAQAILLDVDSGPTEELTLKIATAFLKP